MMNTSRNYFGLLSVVGLIVLLLIARGLDALRMYVRQHMTLVAYPFYNPILWTSALSALLLAFLLLLLFWFVLTRAPRSVWVCALFLVVGLYLALSRPLYFVPALSSLLPASLAAELASTASYTTLAGSFVALMGFFALVLPRRA